LWCAAAAVRAAALLLRVVLVGRTPWANYAAFGAFASIYGVALPFITPMGLLLRQLGAPRTTHRAPRVRSSSTAPLETVVGAPAAITLLDVEYWRTSDGG
jgi:hypothetical protein